MILRPLAAATILAAAVPAGAVVVVSNTTIHNAAFAVSNSDLLQTHLLVGVGNGSFDREGEQGFFALNDGGFGAVGSVNEGNANLAAATADGSNVATYTLDGAYNLTSIATYAGWDAFRGGQSYTVSYATAAAPTTFVALASEFNDATGGGDVATRAVITSTSPYLATNVVAVQFAFNSDLTAGYAGYRELDVFGTTVPEPATWALMIAGFGFVGAAARRRARVVAA